MRYRDSKGVCRIRYGRQNATHFPRGSNPRQKLRLQRGASGFSFLRKTSLLVFFAFQRYRRLLVVVAFRRSRICRIRKEHLLRKWGSPISSASTVASHGSVHSPSDAPFRRYSLRQNDTKSFWLVRVAGTECMHSPRGSNPRL